MVLTLKSGRKVPSREIAFPGLANRHLRETTGFPDLLIGISGKPPVSATCLTRFESSVWARNKTRRDFDEANSMFSMACEDRLVCGGSVFYFLWKRFNCETQASLPSEVPHVLHLDTASTLLGLHSNYVYRLLKKHNLTHLRRPARPRPRQ